MKKTNSTQIKKFTNKLKYMVLFLFVTISTFSVSYAVVSLVLKGEKTYTITHGNIDFKLDNEKNAIRLMNAYPMSDEEGQKLTAYTFSLTNIGTVKEYYRIALVPDTKAQSDCNNCKFLPLSKLRYSVTVNGITQDANTLSKNIVLDSGYLNVGETNNYELRIWLSWDATIEEENKYYYGKIKVDASQTELEKLMVVGNQIFEIKTDIPDFSQISSETNGRGIYKYTEDGEDIYYWRGKVTDNHVIFAGYCWEMVRTTKTGGVKMIYDGVPSSNGSCNNSGLNSQLENTSKINSNIYFMDVDLVYAGYMYGTVYKYNHTSSEQETGKYLYGNDAIWDGTKYTLNETITTTGTWSTDYKNIANAHHYTCFNDTGICDTVYYIHSIGSANGSYITLSNGKKVETILEEIQENNTNSTIKEIIDEWYKINIDEKGYTNKLEDTIYCNDRSVDDGYYAGWSKDGDASEDLEFSVNIRNWYIGDYKPILECKKKNDSFTVNNKIGNGKLTYPVGLLTADEVALAGGRSLDENRDYYLYTGQSFWLLSPYEWNDAFGISQYEIDSIGELGFSLINNAEQGIRPVITLSNSIVFISGKGTETDPFMTE